MKNVVVLGASPKTDRYAFMAMQRLAEKGHNPIPVNPAYPEVLKRRCYPDISEVPQPIDTVSVYLGPAHSTPLVEEIIKAKPKRIIFNPGAENEELEAAARMAGIETVNGCTLVMLGSGMF
jgi:hypothetical protein